MTWTTGIVTALIGAAAGAGGSFLNPWGKWLFERRKLLRADRKEKLVRLRGWVHGMWTCRTADELLKDQTFHVLEPHLTRNTFSAIERWKSDPQLTNRDAVVVSLQRDIAKLERRWKLV